MPYHLLSIQSHVAFGHVGNCAAVFPLQRQGFEVTAIHTVQFSNHTGYEQFKGDVFPPTHLRTVLDGVEQCGALDNMSALLSGYLGDQNTGEVVLDALARIRARQPNALYCCDPVMGDVGCGFYVQDGLPEWIRDNAIRHADMITPNQFELSFLADHHISSLNDAIKAAQMVRKRGPKQVLLTSLDVKELAEDEIGMLLDNEDGCYLVVTPKLDFKEILSGAGDATSALFLAQLLKGAAPEQALQFVAASVYALLKQTAQSGERELQLIDAQDAMLNPSQLFQLKKIL
ncbi:pyridoxal kinase PdxY [Celerinatantimonas diazotrophica]|uniref:pyridoxal kinase n=1 Tax=Celerinatantimonas diazotrophica TaxID=412034 RepID=A0A4R1JA07_9GAMM|nr:pyridoxal kinase PdxY [Celerinatantimonas diazotrophica]TCK47452.1 pyridoxine kinase [Celerinatantimonas diazotrophica]CAG9294929.1 Pyridoxal kinase PdxY [Celerinatantimonas diazotrophica]